MPAATRSVDPSISRTPLPLDAEDLATVCVLCSHNCGLRVDVKGGRIAAIRADESNPITKGYVCNKAFSVGHYAHHDQRTRHPQRRRPDGSFERISWDEAIDEIAAKLGAIRREHSPRSIGLVGIGGQANHLDGPYGLSFLEALGSRRWFNALAQEKTQHWLVGQWMFDLPPTAFFHADAENTHYLLVIGTNPRISNRGKNPNDTFRRIVEKPDCRVAVVDPRETETTRGADRHLRLRPGSDVYLLLGMAATIAGNEGLVDAAFLAERTRDFEALRAALAEVDVGEMARRCDLPVEQLVETAREFASAESAAILWDLALEQTPFSTLDSYLVHALCALTGNVGRPGGNIFMENSTPPQWSAARHEEPERALASGIPAIAALGGGIGMFSPTLVPEEVLLDHPERLRALIVEGANPYLSYSDTSRWREARDALDLLVVIEPAMTETAHVADYVLPTPVGYEKWEWALFPNGYPDVHGQLRPPVIPGPEEALPEAEIYARLFEAMALAPAPPAKLFELAEEAQEPAGAMAYLGELQQAAGGDRARSLFWSYRTLGPTLPAPPLVAIWVICHENAFLRAESVVRALGDPWQGSNPFELAAELFRRVVAHPEGVRLARISTETNYEDHVGFEDKKVRMAPPEMLEEIARAAATDLPTDPDYPLVLAAGLRTPWTANTIQRDPRWRKGKGPHCALHLAPDDAAQLGIAAGERVRIETRRGSAEAPAAIDPKLRAGHVWLPNGFGVAYPNGDGLEVQGVNLNELTDARDRDPFTGCPHHKYTLCRVERV